MFVVIFLSISINWTLSLFILLLAAIANLSGLSIAVITFEILLNGKSGNKQHKDATTFINLQLFSTFVGTLLTGELYEKMGCTCSILLMDLIFIVGYIGKLQIPVSFGIGMGSKLIPLFVAASYPPNIRGTIIKN